MLRHPAPVVVVTQMRAQTAEGVLHIGTTDRSRVRIAFLVVCTWTWYSTVLLKGRGSSSTQKKSVKVPGGEFEKEDIANIRVEKVPAVGSSFIVIPGSARRHKALCRHAWGIE